MHNAADGQPQNGVAPDRGNPDQGGVGQGVRDPGPDDRGCVRAGAGALGIGDGHGRGAAASLREAIAAAAAMLRLAEGIATAGRKVDLAGLDDRLGRICAQALDLPPAEGARLRAELVALLGDLDALAAALRQA